MLRIIRTSRPAHGVIKTMANVHAQGEEYAPSEFLNTIATKVRRDDVIIERDPKGKVTHHAKVTDVMVNPPGCWNHVHVTVRSGTVWCYDTDGMVEIDLDERDR